MIVKVRGPGKRVEDVAINLFMQVKDLKALVANVFHVEPENQRLIHRGKQLEDEHKLWDYGLEIYDTVLLTVKPKVIQKEVVTKNQEPFSIIKHLKTLRQIPQSKHFKVGEYVDFLDTHFGAWFQGKIKIIYVEDQARLDAISEDAISEDAISEDADPPAQRNGESRDDRGSTVVSDNTKDTPDPSTGHRDSPVVISDDDSVDVVTVRSSSPESVIYVPHEDNPVIYVEGDDELQIYVPPPIYVEPYSEATMTVDTTDSAPELEVLQESIRDQSSKTTSAVSDTNGVKTVDTAGSGQRSNASKQKVHQETTSDAANAVSVIRGGKKVGAPGSKPVGAPGFKRKPNETEQEALQRALQEALQAMTCQFTDKINAAGDADHSESGDSGHSSHMSLKNTPQSNGRPGCDNASNVLDDGCLYEIINLNNIDQIEMVCKLSQVRPMSRKRLDLAEIEGGQTVLVNYSSEDPEKIGHWFDFKVSKVVNGSKKKWLEGDVKVLNWNPYQVTNVKITKVDMIWQIEKLTLLKQREDFCSAQNVQKRPVRPVCDNCNDNLAAQCRACSCRVCGMKSDPSKQIMCDECDSPFHVWCLNPPLAEVPDVDQWFCDSCNMTSSTIVKAGATPRIGKKRGPKPKIKTESPEVSSKSPKGKSASPKRKNTSVKRKDTSLKERNSSLKENTPRKEMGDSATDTSFSPRVMSVCTVRQNMANAQRTKKCTIVPPNHFGHIPGVEVGTTWRFRIQASEAGVHRPPVGGMHGREDVGAFSIVLSGGYEDDEDYGDWFWYTGAGGRDLSGNRRTTSRQSCDQLFTHTNKALAVNCDCPVSDEGGKAVDWRAGKPVRVLRSYKFRKRSAYAPEEGIRYDGLYKVIEYRPERGRSGFIVWRYLLRRDDPTPAPWTDEGKRLMEALGLQIEYPENYEPPEPKKKSEGSSRIPTENHVTNENEENSLNYRVKLEPQVNVTVTEQNHATDENEENSLNKRLKPEPYELHPSIEAIISKDEQNMRLWEFCSFHLRDGQKSYLKAVQDSFTCISCHQLLNQPITTPCGHNICMDCLQRSFEAENYTCPTCSEALPDCFPFVVNEHLSEVLKTFFPGYAPQT